MMDAAIEKLSSRDPVSWIEKNFYIPETRDDPDLRGRIGLLEYQKDVLREILTPGEDGLYKYSIVVWSDIKKSAKSTIAAAVSLYLSLHAEWGEFYVIANDLKQADSRVAHYIRRGIELSPELRERCRMNGYKIMLPSGSFIEAVPIDPSGEAGSNANLIIFSELWGANEDAKAKMWCLDEQSEILTKRGWVRGPELLPEDIVAAYDDGEIKWEKPAGIFCEDYAGVLHLYQHKNFSVMCTPDHRLFGEFTYDAIREGSNRYNKKSVMRSREFLTSDYNYYHPVIDLHFDAFLHKENVQTVEYCGKVWCPTVSTGLFVARREGRPFITGNSEMTLSPTKHGQSFRWVESYAGFAEESALLYSLYEKGVKNGRLLWPDRLYPVTEGEPTPLELYVNDEARMLCLWNTQPRCPWQTKKYYASEASILKPNEFLRMHRNQWVSSTQTFVPMEWWDACERKREEWPDWESLEKDTEGRTQFHPKKWGFIISLDAAVSGDTFGLWMGCRHPRYPADVMTIFAWKWAPPAGGKIDFQGTEEEPGPELMVTKLVEEYNVIEVAYDPYQLHDMATRLKRSLRTWFRPFGQGNERLLSDSQLYDLIRSRRIWHRGEPDLRTHLQNADAKIDNEDHKMRIVKRSERMKVDLAVAMAMGSYEILRLNL